MFVTSVNRALPRLVSYRGQSVRTGIFKEPVPDRIAVRRLGLDGDAVVDLRYHGGTNKAVYGYPAEHYPDWERHVGRALAPGTFGENFTTTGLLETDVCLGDRFRFGTAVLEAAQPRSPCFKLGIKMGDPRFIKAFHQAGRPGIYWRVVEEGEVAAGDRVELTERATDRVSIFDVWAMVHGDAFDPAKAKAALATNSLGPEWREPLEESLNP
jgi:MOSC domain-containing protein YiiM